MEKVNVSEIRKELKWKFGKYRILVSIENDDLNITIARGTFIGNMPICYIIDKLAENTELAILNVGDKFVLTYHKEQKGLSIENDRLHLADLSDDSSIAIEL